MITIGFEKITPTPGYPQGISNILLLAYKWESRAQAVLDFKAQLKSDLRNLQLGRCCYCRRHLGDTRDTHLEHYLEKSVYPNFRFEIPNLGLSCSTCNGSKLSAYIRLSKSIERRRERVGATKIASHIVPGLHGAVGVLMPNPTLYRWVHPHYDKYSEHIQIKKSWVYAPQSRKGFRTIRGLKLNVLGEIERRARRERLIAQTGLIGLLFKAAAEVNTAASKDLFSDLAHAIRQRKNA